ncbi:MAG: respiratory nitrate reductase subunit gamma [Nitrospiraceae bacterium]|nr:respiratory nitrate reductase subunit gamma [Nitrospiraceae bacterium]
MPTFLFILPAIIYAAVLIFAVGIVWHFIYWLRSPNPLKIPSGAAPTNAVGTFIRASSEIIFFTSLGKGEKGLWLGSYLFHLLLLMTVLGHLRYFFYPVPAWVLFFSSLRIYTVFIFMLSILYLIIRKIAIDRMRYISKPIDYFYLLVLFSIGLTGLIMKFVARPVLVDIKDFILHINALSPIRLPETVGWFFILHLCFVLLILIIFPFSKLMHAGGVFITPTRLMINNPRLKKHINPWADKEWTEKLKDSANEADSYKPWSVEQWSKRCQR